MPAWLILTATLPTTPSGLRVRVWRALKATGAGTLREGVYLLPSAAPSAQTLARLERTIQEAGAEAFLLQVDARDAAQEATFRALFDRSEHYAELLLSVKDAHKVLRTAAEAELHKLLRSLEQQLVQVQASDFFPGQPQAQAVQAVAALRREVELQFSPDEPAARQAAIKARKVEDFQGRTWATRQRPWVDRLATAWLVQRFVDRHPTFLWLQDAKACPADAIGYDFDGATFTHVGERVTFEVVARSFGLDASPAVQRIGKLVRCIDVGGVPQDEAPGLELLVRGLQARHADDEALLQAGITLFDTLHAALSAPPRR